MKLLKWILVGLLLAYVAYIAWPVLRAYVIPTDTGPAMTRQVDQGDFSTPMSVPDSPMAVEESIQGETATVAMETGNIPVVTLWGAVIALYLLAALLFANGNMRASLAYGSAFLADVALTFLTKGQAGSGLVDRLLEILSGWDPRYILTLVALVLGFLLVLARSRPARIRSGQAHEAA